MSLYYGADWLKQPKSMCTKATSCTSKVKYVRVRTTTRTVLSVMSTKYSPTIWKCLLREAHSQPPRHNQQQAYSSNLQHSLQLHSPLKQLHQTMTCRFNVISEDAFYRLYIEV